LEIPGADSEFYLNLCWEIGASGVQEDFPANNWYRIYFPKSELCQNAEREIRKASKIDKQSITVTTGEICDTGWSTHWHKFFKPVRIGKHILVLPVWETDIPTEHCVIRINPGQAFGTGNHPTTTLCLELLETICTDEMDVLDAGCGSGVLSIAAAKQNARSVTGIDNEATAVFEAAGNAAINDVAAHCRFVKDKIETASGQYDLILGNLQLDFFMSKSEILTGLMKKRSQLILSGFYQSEAKAVAAVISEEKSIDVQRMLYKNEWAAIHVVRDGW
jgi:ribosomal protein L11 methyltransferase